MHCRVNAALLVANRINEPPPFVSTTAPIVNCSAMALAAPWRGLSHRKRQDLSRSRGLRPRSPAHAPYPADPCWMRVKDFKPTIGKAWQKSVAIRRPTRLTVAPSTRPVRSTLGTRKAEHGQPRRWSGRRRHNAAAHNVRPVTP